jgi:hypothetical protein
MFKVWGKIIIDNKITNAIDLEDISDMNFEDKRIKAFNDICYAFDLSVPVWLDKHTKEFISFKRVTFYPEDFVENVNFDKLVIDLISSDEKK